MNMQKDITRWKQDLVNFQSRILELQKQREKYGIELSQAGFAPISQAFRPFCTRLKEVSRVDMAVFRRTPSTSLARRS